MTQNIGSTDRVLRVIAALALFAVGFGVLDGTTGTIVGAIGLVPLLTSAVGSCPVYQLFNFSSCSRKS